MKTLFDTSVIVAGLVEAHPMHGRTFPWIKQARDEKLELIVAAHTIAECYAVLSSLPIKPRISPTIARRLLGENVESIGKIVSLTAAEYQNTISKLSAAGLAGGITYDALIARVARKERVERLVTLNIEDFRRVWPEGAQIVVAP
jgi:predicted nucleic acid-binding protein